MYSKMFFKSLIKWILKNKEIVVLLFDPMKIKNPDVKSGLDTV